MTGRRHSASTLSIFAERALRAAGANQASAEGCVRALMHASRLGVDSHGIRLLTFYVNCLRSGMVKGDPVVSEKVLRHASGQVDAGGGLAHAPTFRAVEVACDLAARAGVGLVGVVHSTHFGAAGAYALAEAERGYHGLVFCNSGPFVVPFDAAKALHGTNPIAYAAPAGEGRDPFLLDMATSSTPWNHLLLARTLGAELPPDVAVDVEGNYTTDAAAGQMLAPLGGSRYGYKGAGLAGMIEIMSAVLTGMHFGFERDPNAVCDVELGQIVIAIDPGLFGDPATAAHRVAGYIEAVQSLSGDGRTVQAAGGPQWRNKADRDANGIPVPEALHDELNQLARALGVPALSPP
jgi:LDH2 family malate/lactate/ureidoglycolate dehydrogenase